MFLNLSVLQFLMAFGSVAAVSVALYLLDRSRRKQVVATLRFWVVAGQAAPVTRRRRIQQPWSLVLQLLGMLFLLLAIAEFQLNGRQGARRDHVVVLDTSAWMGAQLPNQADTTLMDVARADAISWLRAVPLSDRVMLIRADALATPATAWELDRAAVVKAILQSHPGATALNLSQSLSFASQMQKAGGSATGEIVYVGPGRISSRETSNMTLPRLPTLRVLNVNDAVENVGFRSVGARRAAAGQDAWDVLARVRNYGRRTQTVTVTLAFGGAPEGSHGLEIPPGGEQETSFQVHTRAAGILEARLYPKDGFGADNYAALEIPQVRMLHVVVYTDSPRPAVGEEPRVITAERLRPALASDPRVFAEFRPASQYKPDNDGLMILDHFRPAQAPQGNVLWINPPAGNGSPVIKEQVEHPVGLEWTPDQAVTSGLRVRDLQMEMASVLTPREGDLRLAEIDRGPIAIASTSPDGKSHTVVLGFDPFAPAMRYELSTPLLLANIFHWMAPAVFRDVDVATQSAGAVVSQVSVDESKGSEAPQVLTDGGVSLPYNVRDRQVQFFTGDSSRVRVISGNTERVYSLTLPEMWDAKWTAPAGVRRGIPAWNDELRRTPDFWPFLAAIGTALLLAEWFLYGRFATSGIRLVHARAGKAA